MEVPKRISTADGMTDGGRGSIAVVIACFIGVALGFGPIFAGTFSVFIKPLGTDYGWNRSALSAGVSVASLFCALASPLLGLLADRIGPKRPVVVSTALFALGMAALTILPASYPAFLATTALIGISAAGTTTLLYAAILAQWFDRRLGLSLGIAMTGVGLASAVSPWAIQQIVGAYGWRAGYLAIALLVGCISLPSAILLLRENPAWRRDRSDGCKDRATAAGLPPGLTRRQAMRTVIFWRAMTAIMLMALVATGISVHLVALLTDRGADPASAAAYLSAFGIAVIVSRLATGFLLDRVRSGLIGATSFAAPALGIGLIAFGAAGPQLALGLALLGLAYGAEGNLLAYIVRQHFGMKAYGAIYGSMFAAFNLGVLLGPLLMGASFDLLGGYTPALSAFVVLSLVAAILIEASGRSPGQPPHHDPAADD